MAHVVLGRRMDNRGAATSVPPGRHTRQHSHRLPDGRGIGDAPKATDPAVSHPAFRITGLPMPGNEHHAARLPTRRRTEPEHVPSMVERLSSPRRAGVRAALLAAAMTPALHNCPGGN